MDSSVSRMVICASAPSAWCVGFLPEEGPVDPVVLERLARAIFSAAPRPIEL